MSSPKSLEKALDLYDGFISMHIGDYPQKTYEKVKKDIIKFIAIELDSIREETLEECAKVAEAYSAQEECSYSMDGRCKTNIAKTLRSLKGKEE